MSEQRATLEQIQRWMQSVIMHPGGAVAGVDSPGARQHLEIASSELDRVIRPSRALSSAERLEIYVDAYFERLLECLREEFAATRVALGDDLFGAVSFGYLQQHPSSSYTLNRLGARFPDYLAESRLHDRAMPEDAGPDWSDFIVELAALERLMRDVFDGPGSEGKPVLNVAQLGSIPADHLADIRLDVVPCLRMRAFSHPVESYWMAVKGDEAPRIPPRRPSYLAINRRDYVVERRELTRAQFEILSSLQAGGRLQDGLRAAAELPDADWQTLQRNVPGWFAEWTAVGFFSHVV